MLKDIYFINVSELSKRISSGEADKALMFKHFIVFSMLFYTGFSVPISLSGEPSNAQGWLFLLLTFIAQAAIHYYGIWYTFQINNKGDGEDYFYRLFSLALPISIRLLIYALLISVLFSAVFLMLFSIDVEPNDVMVSVLYFTLSGVYSGAFYYLIGKYIRACSNGS